MEIVIFFIFAVIAVGSAIAVVTFRNPVHSALALMVCFFQVAAIFVLLRSPFLAAAQIFVYVGAVMVLFLFAVMVLNLGGHNFEEPIFHRSIWGIVIILGFMFEVIYMVMKGTPAAFKGAYIDGAMLNNTEVFGKLLYTKYIYPFEIISVLLLMTLVGAIVLAMKERRKN